MTNATLRGDDDVDEETYPATAITELNARAGRAGAKASEGASRPSVTALGR
jgi:hypothetical protein